MKRWWWLFGLGCGAVEEPPESLPDCHPLAADWDCLGPYPSDLWRRNGLVGVSGPALPQFEKLDGTVVPFDPFELHSAAGYSVLPTLVASLDAEIDPSNLVAADEDPALSVGEPSPTVIVEVATGRRVGHIAELDAMAVLGQRRLLVIRPIERLRDGATYAVGVRGLVDADGSVIAANAGFVEAKGGGPAADEVAAAADALASAGVPTDDLQLAWTFTTRPLADGTGDLVRVRELALEAFADAPPAVAIDVVERDVRDDVAIRLEGRIVAPNVLVPDASDPDVSRLARGADGRVALAGTVEVPFVVLVPRAAVGGGARAIQYGHGFFGDRFEVDDGDAASLGARGAMISFAIDWTGMSAADLFYVVDGLLGEPSEAGRFTDRVLQGMLEQMAMARAIKTTFAELPELRGEDGPLYDATRVDYVGSSLGGILGGTYLSVAPDVEHGTLGVAGGGFTLMMLRALPFEDFARILSQGLADSGALLQWTAVAQTSFDRIDPAVYAPYLLAQPLPSAQAERGALLQLGIGDTQVPNIAGRALARAFGATHLTPAPQEIWGLPTSPGPITGAAVVEFDFGVPAPLPGTTADLSWDGNSVHGAVRNLAAGQEQISRFFRTNGAVEHTCDGPCDPE
jgi:hypothetical protein